MKKRYVVYSDELGIYLGFTSDHPDGTAWSNRNPGLYSTATTFEPDEPVRDDEHPDSLASILAMLHEKGFSNLRAVEVWPTSMPYRATIDDCANAQLPRWNPRGA